LINKKIKDFSKKDFENYFSDRDYVNLVRKLDRELKFDLSESDELEPSDNQDNVDSFEMPEEKIKNVKIIKGKAKLLKIEFGKVIFKSPEDSCEKHTPESRKKLSIARRSRKKQPREGTSKKPQNLYAQLVKDYPLKGNSKDTMEDLNAMGINENQKKFIKKKKTKKDIEEIENFLKKNKKFLEDCNGAEVGILTDYSEQNHTFSEVSVDEVIFDPQQKVLNSFENNIDDQIDEILFKQDLEENLQWYREDGMGEHFLDCYEKFRIYRYELEKALNKTNVDEKRALPILKKHIMENYPHFLDWFLEDY